MSRELMWLVRPSGLVAPLTVFVALSCAAAIFALGLWIMIAAPTFVRGVESNVLFTIQKHLSGRPIYTDPSDLPHDVAQYGPLFYLICAGLARMLRVSAIDPAVISMIARGVSLACSVGVFWLIYGIQVGLLGVSRTFALTAACFAFAACSPWMFLARPDALMYLLLISSFGALLRVDRGSGIARRWWLGAAAFLAVGCMFAKQNGVVAVAILLGTLFVSDRKRDALMATALVIALTAILGIGAQATWPHMKANVVDGVNNGINVINAILKTYAMTFAYFAFPLSLGMVIVMKWAALPSEARTFSQNALVVAICLTFTFAVATGLKAGSAEGYFNEALMLTAIAVSCFLASKKELIGLETRDLLITTITIFLLLFLPFWTVSQVHLHYVKNIQWDSSSYRPLESFRSTSLLAISDFMRRELDEDPEGLVISWSLALNNFLPDHCVVPQKEVIALMQQQGVIDLARLERSITDGRLRYAVRSSSHPGLPAEILGIALPPARCVHEESGLRVYRFDSE